MMMMTALLLLLVKLKYTVKAKFAKYSAIEAIKAEHANDKAS